MPTNAEIREWARANMLNVGKRGRLSQRVIEKYLAAHQEGTENE